MPHLVLLGDSVFDNGAYTGREPEVIEHLRSVLPADWQATLAAVDGATTAGLPSQVRRVPADATHLVVSVGGNDALRHLDLLHLPVASTAEALALFDERATRFEADYREALGSVLALGLPTTVCTIYNGNLEDREEARLARVALMIFNDAILRVALEHRLGIIELRLVCSEPGDYANPIEPSGQGGWKIARAIAEAAGAAGVATDRRSLA
jgi:hypothetical protein